MERIEIPAWITKTNSFDASVLSQLLTVPEGATSAYAQVAATPYGPSSASLVRQLDALVMGWLEENLTEPGQLDPADYLFEPLPTEPVPTAWLEAIFSIEVREDASLSMDEASE